MTPEQFAYWLQGYAEVHGEPPSTEQWQMIRDHLQTVFEKVTPAVRFPGIVKDGPDHRIVPASPTVWPLPETTRTVC